MKRNKIRQWFILSIVITILVTTVKVSATPIPFAVPISRPSEEDNKIKMEESKRQYDGVYKLGDNPIVIEVTDEDYTKFETLFKEKREWKESQIYKKTINDILRTDNILVYDLRNLRGYEIPKEELNETLDVLELKPKINQEIDIVEIRKGNKTQVLNFQKIVVKSNRLKPISVDVPDYKIKAVENAIKTVEDERIKPLKSDKLFIYINGTVHNITNEELIKITKVIDSRQALRLNEKITVLEETSKSYNNLLNFLVGILIILLIFKLLLDFDLII